MYICFFITGVPVRILDWQIGSRIGFQQRMCQAWILYNIGWDFKISKFYPINQ
jgi:hypothetical protein